MSATSRRYKAFISYRHADNREAGRQWASWLHQAIETYEIPQDLVGSQNARGEVIPERLFPIFRDEDELPADSNLGQAITRALDASDMLVVLCSPRSVQSTYVAEEIDYFKKSGKSGQILAVILDGEPNVSLDRSKQSAGFTPEQECFPRPLQFEYQDGQPTAKRAEPIAADFRILEDGRMQQGWTNVEAYRQFLKSLGQFDANAIQSRCETYRAQHQLMLMKIIAALLGLPVGELSQRDKQYQLEKERLKSKNLRRWLTALGLASAAAISFALVAKDQQAKAQQNLLESQAQTRALYASLSDVAYQEGNHIEGILYALMSVPSDGTYPALYRNLANNREVFLPPEKLQEAIALHKHTTPPNELETQPDFGPNRAVSLNGQVSLVESKNGEYASACGLQSAFDLVIAGESVSTYCQPSGKLDLVTPTLSPRGKWVLSSRLLQEDKALFEVKQNEIIGPSFSSHSIGFGQIANDDCIAFNENETIIGYQTFDNTIKVETIVDDWSDTEVLILPINACPVALIDSGLILVEQNKQWRTFDIESHSPVKLKGQGEFNYPEPLPLHATSPDGSLRAELTINSEQSNQLRLFATDTQRLIVEYPDLETEFISSATGYNYPWKVEFDETGENLLVHGLKGATQIPMFQNNAALFAKAKAALPCSVLGEAGFVSEETQRLCRLLESKESLQ